MHIFIKFLTFGSSYPYKKIILMDFKNMIIKRLISGRPERVSGEIFFDSPGQAQNLTFWRNVNPGR